MRVTKKTSVFNSVNWKQAIIRAISLALFAGLILKMLGCPDGLTSVGIVMGVLTAFSTSHNNKSIRFWGTTLCGLGVAVICVHCIVNGNPSEVEEALDTLKTEVSVSEPELSPSPSEDVPSENEVNEAIQFLTPDQVEQELLTGTNSYLPEIEPLDTQHLFLMSTHMTNLETDAEMRSEQTRLFVYERYKNFLHEKENFSAAAVNGDPELSHLILSAEQYDLLVRERIATYDSPVEPYEELIRIYEEACAAAPRGEFFLQLARPYSEIILYIPRETQSEKDLLFSYGSQAVHAFLETLTYQNVSAESDADILYRIGAVYHTLGDTSGLTQDARLELYQLAGAFLENATSLVTPEDSSYGYAPYYCGVVMHKLAITASEPTHKLFFLTKAHDYYVSALDVGSFNRVTETAILNALENVEYRSAFLTK